MKNSSWWSDLFGRAAFRLAVLAAAFLLAMGVGAATVLLYENGLPLSAGAAPDQQQEAPLPSDGAEQGSDDAARDDAAASDAAGDDAAGEGGQDESRQDTAAESAEESGGDSAIGVWYSAADQRWTIFNEDLSEMPEGSVFEVYAFPPSDLAFIHAATAENTSDDTTYIDSIATDGNPNTALSVTQNWSSEGVYNEHRIGARYDTESKQWTIFNEDGEAIPEGAAFNVGVFPLDEPTFVHETGADNTTENWTYLDDPLVNDDPDAILFVVQR